VRESTTTPTGILDASTTNQSRVKLMSHFANNTCIPHEDLAAIERGVRSKSSNGKYGGHLRKIQLLRAAL
jgi:hypothetical protein